MGVGLFWRVVVAWNVWNVMRAWRGTVDGRLWDGTNREAELWVVR